MKKKLDNRRLVYRDKTRTFYIIPGSGPEKKRKEIYESYDFCSAPKRAGPKDMCQKSGQNKKRKRKRKPKPADIISFPGTGPEKK